MFVHLVPSADVESVSVEANEILTTTVEEEEDSPTTVVAEGETLEMNTPTFIEFTDPKDAVSTTVLIKPSAADDEATVAVFTQHVPSEFMAHALRDAESGAYVFPTTPTLYIDKTAPAPVINDDDNPPAREEDVDPDNCAAEGGRSQSCGATNPDRPPTCCVGLVCSDGSGVRCVAGPPTTSAPTGAPVEAVDVAVAATTPAPTPVETLQPTADGAGTTDMPTGGSTDMGTDMSTDGDAAAADAVPPGVRDDPSVLADDATSSAFAIASIPKLVLAVCIASAAIPVLLL